MIRAWSSSTLLFRFAYHGTWCVFVTYCMSVCTGFIPCVQANDEVANKSPFDAIHDTEAFVAANDDAGDKHITITKKDRRGGRFQGTRFVTRACVTRSSDVHRPHSHGRSLYAFPKSEKQKQNTHPHICIRWLQRFSAEKGPLCFLSPTFPGCSISDRKANQFCCKRPVPVIVAFRGSKGGRDWLTNLSILLRGVPEDWKVQVPDGGLHRVSGFHSSCIVADRR